MAADIKVEKFVVNINQENSYLVYIDNQPEIVCIDPGDEADKIARFATKNGLSITKILITHAHLDHINAVGQLKKLTGAQIYCHRADLFLYEEIDKQAGWLGISANPLPPVDHFVTEGDLIQEGRLSFKVLHTPGHSPGGVCYSMENICFVGDTIFAQSIGRSDLPGGSEQQLFRSIQSQILSLPDHTLLYSGHGPLTTVADERELNPFCQHL